LYALKINPLGVWAKWGYPSGWGCRPINAVFGIISMQTDNIIILADKRFLAQEKKELKQTKYTTKPKENLTKINLLLFNSYVFYFRETK
jgi:hypothetical protein